MVQFSSLEKIIIKSKVEYINSCADNLIDIEIFNKNYENIKKYYQSGLDKNKIFDNFGRNNNMILYLFENVCYNIDLIKYLIEEIKIPLNYKNRYGYTELHKCNNKEIFEYLLNMGSDITVLDNNNRSVLYLIGINNDLELVKYICQKLNEKRIDIKNLILNKDFYNKNLLNHLADNNDIETFKYLIETYKITILSEYIIESIVNKSDKIFDYLIKPESLRIKDSNGSNLLHIAIENKNKHAIYKIYELNPELIKHKNNNQFFPNEMTSNKMINNYILLVQKRHEFNTNPSNIGLRIKLKAEIEDLEHKQAVLDKQ
jgi:hypothetical protein